MKKYKHYFTDRDFMISVLIAAALLFISLIVNFYAVVYATDSASNSVTDIVLSNIRVFDVDGIFIYGAIILWAFIVLLAFKEPRRVPFVFKTTALFILIRSVFISLTHIGPFPNHILASPLDLLNNSKFGISFFFGSDLFFSGHTGIPFLMALIFWQNKILRYFFLLASVIFGAAVLMAHVHYSIDVLSAYFITYTIYHLAEQLFKKDKRTFEVGLAQKI